MAGDQDCGCYGFYPRWLRNRATSKAFIIVYGLLGTIQAMSFVYVIVTLTTLEKRFKIPSRTTGIILSGNEISQILSLVLIYYGGSGHRPRWIAVGVGLSAISCLVLALPHFIYGSGKDALALTKEHLDQNLLNATTGSKDIDICPRTAGPETCDEDALLDISILPRLLVFVSQFILGIGTTLYYSLGQTYIDDNVKKTNTPMLLGFTFALRTIGPVFGFMLGYLCLSIYIEPSLHPVITKEDPRWLGAWWLGWILLGIAMGLFALLVAMFPRELPRSQPAPTKSQEDGEIPLKLDLVGEKKFPDQQEISKPQAVQPNSKPNMKEFPKAMKRLLTNKVVIFNNSGAVLYVLGASGFITFLTKYLEVQFGTSAATGPALAGPISLLGMVLGFLVSGIIISKYKPGPRIILGWNIMVGFCFLFGMICYAFLGCNDTGIQGLDMETHILNLTAPCNAGCSCDGIKYSPVCHVATKTTFFSACHAGCTTTLNNTEFGNCACISTLTNSTILNNTEQSINDKVKAGPCPRDCGAPYVWFIVLASVIQCLACSGKIGNVLVNYRAVEPQDKSIAQGFSLMLISLFGLIPGPIIYGALIDSTCLIWEESCGEKGNCWYHHTDNFRYLLNFTGAGFVLVGICFDCTVWYFAKDLDFYGSSEEDKRREFAKTEHPAVVSNEISKSAVVNGIVNPDHEIVQNHESDVQ